MFKRKQSGSLEATPEEQRRHAGYVDAYGKVENLDEDRWAKLGKDATSTEEELRWKRDALQDAEYRCAAVDGRDPAIVVFDDDPEWRKRFRNLNQSGEMEKYCLRMNENARYVEVTDSQTKQTERYMIVNQKCKDSAPECVRHLSHEQSHAYDVHQRKTKDLGPRSKAQTQEKSAAYHDRPSEVRANARAFGVQRDRYPNHQVDHSKLTQSEKKGLQESNKLRRQPSGVQKSSVQNKPVSTRRGKPKQSIEPRKKRQQQVQPKPSKAKPANAPPRNSKANAPKPAPTPKVKSPKGPSK